MPTATYIALANLTLTATDTDVTFSSIPATYRDLVAVVEGELSTANTPDLQMKINADSSNYSQVYMRGNGSATASGTYTAIYLNSASTWSSGRRYSHLVHIMDYSAIDKHKTVLARGNWAGGDINATASRWASTNAVTSISFTVAAGSFAIGTTFALYGIVS
jgi:hypothetical protein